MPVHHHDQVEKAAGRREVGDVGGPYLVRPANRQPAQPVWIDPVSGRRAAGLWLWTQGFEAHYPYEPPHPLAVDQPAGLEQCRFRA